MVSEGESKTNPKHGSRIHTYDPGDEMVSESFHVKSSKLRVGFVVGLLSVVVAVVVGCLLLLLLLLLLSLLFLSLLSSSL